MLADFFGTGGLFVAIFATGKLFVAEAAFLFLDGSGLSPPLKNRTATNATEAIPNNNHGSKGVSRTVTVVETGLDVVAAE